MLDRNTHGFNVDVHIFDTDCYGVMWHGAYTKWLEMGRVNFLKDRGIDLPKPDAEELYVFPVVDQHLRFRAPARMGEVLRVETRLAIHDYKLVFHQACQNPTTNKTTLEATTTCVVLDRHWKPLRTLPAFLTEKLGVCE